MRELEGNVLDKAYVLDGIYNHVYLFSRLSKEVEL